MILIAAEPERPFTHERLTLLVLHCLQTTLLHHILGSTSKMVKPIPDNVKDILGQLSGPQQVAIRGYIATLRSEIKDLEADLLAAKDSDPHAHYHGHEKCTADHGHAEAEHEEHEHEHKHSEHKEHDHGHEHAAEKHDDHAHEHHDHHEHEHHDHGHKHGHDDDGHDKPKAKKDDVPAWKKAAMESGDASAAPFGGSWNAESNVSASDKMQE